jgi:hypothetical protein
VSTIARNIRAGKSPANRNEKGVTTMADKDDDLLDSVTAMAERLGLKGKERTTYIHEHMTRSGYRAVPQYVKADDDDDDDGGSGFFGSGRKRKPSGHKRSRDDDDDDGWYP